MESSRIVWFGFAGILAVSPACSGSSSGAAIGNTTGTTADGGGVPTDAASGQDASTTTTPPPKKDASVVDPPAGECAGEATQSACVSCCSKAHQDGAGAYLVATIDCMCLPANCETECATTLCNADNPKNPDSKCATCVNGKNAACAMSIKSACTAAPNCVAFDACIGDSGCTGKTK
jgi:hypothetical protein